MYDNIKEMLIKNEGLVCQPYHCSAGKLTIGVGRNLEANGISEEEAKGNWFQSSWRPATAWVCVAGFAVNFLISPLLAPFGIDVPQADTSTMLPVLMGMLGLGGMRSYEKTKGLTK